MFEVCPRCNLAWSPISGGTNFTCDNCQLDYIPDWNVIAWAVSYPPHVELTWYCNKKMCQISLNGTYIDLPWLPFDISKEKLKLYLNFV